VRLLGTFTERFDKLVHWSDEEQSEIILRWGFQARRMIIRLITPRDRAIVTTGFIKMKAVEFKAGAEFLGDYCKGTCN